MKQNANDIMELGGQGRRTPFKAGLPRTASDAPGELFGSPPPGSTDHVPFPPAGQRLGVKSLTTERKAARRRRESEEEDL